MLDFEAKNCNWIVLNYSLEYREEKLLRSFVDILKIKVRLFQNGNGVIKIFEYKNLKSEISPKLTYESSFDQMKLVLS